MLLYTLLENEFTSHAYTAFYNQMKEYADGTVAMNKLRETMHTLHENACQYIAYWSIYDDPAGVYSSYAMFAFSLFEKMFPHIPVPSVAEAGMLLQYSTVSIDLINTLEENRKEMTLATEITRPMKEGFEYLNRQGFGPCTIPSGVRKSLLDYAYNGTLDKCGLIKKLSLAIDGLESYHNCLTDAYGEYNHAVTGTILDSLDPHFTIGNNWFSGTIDTVDALLVAQYYVGLISNFTC